MLPGIQYEITLQCVKESSNTKALVRGLSSLLHYIKGLFLVVVYFFILDVRNVIGAR